VAWASFATGGNPGRHGLFDFLRRDPSTYLPELALFDVEELKPVFKLGPLQWPPSASRMRSPRRGVPFWALTSEARIPTVILRVPMTFPPDRVHGRMLSGLGVPDLRGTQGTFSAYTTEPAEAGKAMGGEIFHVQFGSATVSTHLVGPRNTLKPGQPDVTVPFTIEVHRDNPHATIRLQGESFDLGVGQWSDWKRVDFALNRWTHVPGICRFYLGEVDPHLKLYVSPINFDPRKPAFPISHPPDYAEELADEIGLYHTLGQAEDTWSLNEGQVSDETFLAQCEQVIQEREAMLLYELERYEGGLFVTVFDTPDRIQHMFWRFEDPGHPLYDAAQAERHREVFARLYRSMDRILGKVMERIDADTTLIVLSDHGFSQFRRAVHLNRWLVDEGFMTLKPASGDAKGSSEFFANVDWSRTKAYAVGLAGVYVNLQGRERLGLVAPGAEQQQVAEDLSERLLVRLTDPETGKPIVRRVYRRDEIYAGPYAERAPDLVVGFEPGYRASWQTALGGVPEAVMEPNRKRWSGDHCVDPPLVSGVLFMNRPLGSPEPRIIDIAPTILKIFGIEPPGSVDGRSML
jgi:predicted AlkP superfamily phosphohydrolase/phosphomutase